MPLRLHVSAAILGCVFADDGIPRYPPAPDNGRVSLDSFATFSSSKYTTPVQDTPFWATPGAPPVDFHGDRTSECLEALTAKGDGKFEWLNESQQVAHGTCSDMKTHFSLCEHAPPRECLISRIPWQTATSAISCCFHCCMHYWQDNLGLSDIYRHWFENKEDPMLKDWDYSGGYKFFGGSPGVLDPKDQVSFVPDLDSVVLTVNSVRRFRCSCGTNKLMIQMVALQRDMSCIIQHGLFGKMVVGELFNCMDLVAYTAPMVKRLRCLWMRLSIMSRLTL